MAVLLANETQDVTLTPKRTFDVVLEDGANVIVRAYGHGPRLIMSHGNGLAIDGYKPFWSLLVDRYEVVMFDFRHHGLSSPFTKQIENWPQFIRDFELIISKIQSELGPQEPVGVFHSMSAITSLLHASEYTVPWRAIVAFEPPVPPRVDHKDYEPFFELHRQLAEGAARRRQAFASVDDLARSFGSRASFRRLTSERLYGLAASTLRFQPETNDYHLACEREFEAETFRLKNLGDAWGRVCKVSLPVCIVAGKPSEDENQCLATIAQRIADGAKFAFTSIPDSTHFLQIEQSAACVAALERFIGSSN